MSEINLEEFTEFAEVKDVWKLNDCDHDKYGLHEFLYNVVLNIYSNNGDGKMLSDLSNIYVLVSKENFPFDKLTSNNNISIRLSSATKTFVLGYLWTCPWVLINDGCVPYHFINFIDSRISGLNIAKYMIQKYEEKFAEELYLFPFKIILGSEKYWKKYFVEVYGIYNSAQLYQMINTFKFKDGDVLWDLLFRAFA